jgi:hypothetical protein
MVLRLSDIVQDLVIRFGLQLGSPLIPPILTPPSSWMLAIEATERRTQVIEHDGETAVERSTAADYHIIAVRSHG